MLASVATDRQLLDVREMFEMIWSAETAHPAFAASWSIHRPSIGQCFVTSAVLAEYLALVPGGWRIARGRVATAKGAFLLMDHCWLESESAIIDLTLDQIAELPRVVYGSRHLLKSQLGVVYELAPRRYMTTEAFDGPAATRCAELLDRLSELCVIASRNAA